VAKKKKIDKRDLNELANNLRKVIHARLMAVKKKQEEESGSTQSFWLFSILLLLIIWLISGVFVIKQDESSVVLRFGKYHETLQAGTYWRPQLLDKVVTINTTEVKSISSRLNLLTHDQGLVEVLAQLDYQVTNAHDYLFNMQDSHAFLTQVLLSAVNKVVNNLTLEEILTTNILQKLVNNSVFAEQIVKELGGYQLGVKIDKVDLQLVGSPEYFTQEMTGLKTIREEMKNAIDKSSLYKEQTLAAAKNEAENLITASTFAQEERIKNAKMEVAEYTVLLPTYKKNPKLVKAELYFKALEEILNANTKILFDDKMDEAALKASLSKLLEFKVAAVEAVASADKKKDEVKESTAAVISRAIDQRPLRHEMGERKGYDNN
jgi:modulator of FtsH protease HflK